MYFLQFTYLYMVQSWPSVQYVIFRWKERQCRSSSLCVNGRWSGLVDRLWPLRTIRCSAQSCHVHQVGISSKLWRLSYTHQLNLFSFCMFCSENIDRLASSGKVNALLLDYSNSTSNRPEEFSPDSSCPNSLYGIESVLRSVRLLQAVNRFS